MKKAYCVTYDIEGDPARFSSLFEELKTFAGWWHYIDGTWFITSELDANGIYAKLEKHVKPSINLLVIEVGPDRQGYLPKKAWGWFRKHLPKTPA